MKLGGKDSVSKTKQAYKQIAQDYAHRNATPNPYVMKMLDKFIALIPGKTVIDIGCAEGRETKYFTDRDMRVTGCDFSEEFVTMAQENCPGAHFLVSDMRKLPPDIGTFHGIWASASFLHIPKADAASTLQGFWKILHLGGLLYLSVLEGNFDDTRPNTEMHWPERHFSDYQQVELSEMLQNTGFEAVEVQKNKRENDLIFLNFFCRKS